ncbi:hypothetical protein ACMAZE_05255 [Pseudopelagicola sp. nBUS_20]|uniref:hypothetical protein n=1 Tax=Pseudopelagicola sp. nBUS_20 TaxID=3395317 RepID=UPI003EBB210C
MTSNKPPKYRVLAGQLTLTSIINALFEKEIISGSIKPSILLSYVRPDGDPNDGDVPSNEGLDHPTDEVPAVVS